MQREKIEKLGTLFLAVFTTGLAAQLALDGMSAGQWFGAVAAVLGSLGSAALVRAWPRPERSTVSARSRRDR